MWEEIFLFLYHIHGDKNLYCSPHYVILNTFLFRFLHFLPCLFICLFGQLFVAFQSKYFCFFLPFVFPAIFHPFQLSGLLLVAIDIQNLIKYIYFTIIIYTLLIFKRASCFLIYCFIDFPWRCDRFSNCQMKWVVQLLQNTD